MKTKKNGFAALTKARRSDKKSNLTAKSYYERVGDGALDVPLQYGIITLAKFRNYNDIFLIKYTAIL